MMSKKVIYCDDCKSEFSINYKGEEQPHYCVFCGEELDLGWNSDEDLPED